MRALLFPSFCFSVFMLWSQDDYDLARKYYNEDRLDSARFFINQALGRKPATEDYFLSALIHEAEGKNLRALADYEAVVKRDPENLEAVFQKGMIYYNSASAEQAIKDFTYVIDNFNHSSTQAIYFANDPYEVKGTFITSLQSMLGRVFQYRGLAYNKIGERKKALVDFNESFNYDTLAEYYINRSQLYWKLDQEEEAKRDLYLAIELEPENYLAWYNLALLDPTADLPRELIVDDEFAPMLNLLGANAYERGDYATAASYFDQAIANNDQDALAYLNRGKALLQTGAHKQARADFLQSLQLDSKNQNAFYLIGNSFFYEGDFNQAIGFYERYLSVDVGYENVWYNAAMAYLSIEDKDRACQCLKTADKLGMDEASEAFVKHCDNQ